MEREAYKQLLNWKISENRKPLILEGARQVGKTYLVNMFGKQEYDKFIYLNFEQDPAMASLFEGELKPEKIIQNINLYLGEKIEAEGTLIVFDEIQNAPIVLTSLKYFQEQANEYHIIAAGSLLGVSVGIENSFPVGKVNFMNLYPLSFIEYLRAMGEEFLVDTVLLQDTKEMGVSDLIHRKIMEYLKIYLFLGGMPEVVDSYIKNTDIAEVRTIQYEILEAYKLDFAKYAGAKQAIKTTEVWRSLPQQLSKENKKFKFSDVSKRARASTYELTIDWLQKAGLVHLVSNISTPKIPLSGYADYLKFKLYLHDVGLLGAMLGISSDLIVKPNKLYTEYNGAFIENFVAQELRAYGVKDLFYWTSKSDAEVDFLLQKSNRILPVEVKSGLSRNIKSLRSYADKYQPEKIFRLSPRNYKEDNDFINIPLYHIYSLVNSI